MNRDLLSVPPSPGIAGLPGNFVRSSGSPRLTPADFLTDGTIDLSGDHGVADAPAPINPLPQNGPDYARFRTTGAL